MEQYKTLADAYDYLVQGIDFDEWIDYVEKITKKINTQAKSVADIACGTGNTTIPFAKRGYEIVTGVDIAENMLEKARQKSNIMNLNINFLKQDMRDLNLSRKFDLITCFHDAINYLLSPDDLRKTFKRIHSHLNPGGVFIFDLNTLHWIPEGNNDIAYFDEDELTVVWDSKYRPHDKLWQINLLGFLKTDDDYYIKLKETHMERTYTLEEIKMLLQKSNLSLLHIYDAFSFDPPRKNSIRCFFITQRNDKYYNT